MMESLEGDPLFVKLQAFCDVNEQFRIAFKITEKKAALARRQKNRLHLHYIARDIITIPSYFHDAISHFREFLPKIVSIAIDFDDKVNNFNHQQHVTNCILLGKLVQTRPDLCCYAAKYFERHPSPFAEESTEIVKRSKMHKKFDHTDLDLVESCYLILKSDPHFYGKKWEWSDFTDKYLDHGDVEVRWIACHCIGLVTGMSEMQLKCLITSKMSVEVHEQLSCTYNSASTLTKPRKITGLDQHPLITVDKNVNDEVVEISGVYIHKLSAKSIENNLVIVDSTYHNLRKIALGLSLNKAICLQGPVGSGKTTLVEYLASKTGRKLGENFVKIQLGDQTDSKMLLGTYRCTDIPGEFVWQAGVVTQAVSEGHWLLLEDIDSASMDIASVLSSLLENGSLTVPGYRDCLDVTPGFQLFLTQSI